MNERLLTNYSLIKQSKQPPKKLTKQSDNLCLAITKLIVNSEQTSILQHPKTAQKNIPSPKIAFPSAKSSLPHPTYIQPVEEVIPRLLVLHEELQVLEDPLLDRHLVVVADRVLSEEVEHHHVLLAVELLLEFDVLDAQ